MVYAPSRQFRRKFSRSRVCDAQRQDWDGGGVELETINTPGQKSQPITTTCKVLHSQRHIYLIHLIFTESVFSEAARDYIPFSVRTCEQIYASGITLKKKADHMQKLTYNNHIMKV